MSNEREQILEEIAPDISKKEREAKKKRDAKAEKKTKAYMKSVREFLKEKAGGAIPAEWEMALTMLEVYYKQWLLMAYEINESGSFTTVNSVGNLVEHPLITSMNKAATRLEKQMSELGLSLKSGKKLAVIEPKKKESALDKFLNKEIERR